MKYTEYTYNDRGAAETVKGFAAGAYRTLSYDYDDLGRLTTVPDPMSRQVQYQYGSDGFLASITDLKGNATTWGYNSLGGVREGELRGVRGRSSKPAAPSSS